MDNIIFARDSSGYATVTVDSEPLDWEPSLEHRNHSPTGVEFGYGGSGPSQCALAVLLLFTDPDVALRHYQAFKWEWIAPIPIEGGTIPVASIQSWLSTQERKRQQSQAVDSGFFA